jgi:photosystem II stability/assembly factor-like uncharacterized protein
LVLTNPDAGRGLKFPGFWDGILFFDRLHGVIYGDPVGNDRLSFPLRVTHDGGTVWIPVVGLEALPGESVYAGSNSAMAAYQRWSWLGTSMGRVVRSRSLSLEPSGCAGQIDPNSGYCPMPVSDWHNAQTPLASGTASSGVFSIAFRDQTHGIAVGGDFRKPDEETGTAAYTADGGEHWSAPRKWPHGYRSTVAWDAVAQAWITAGSNGSDISYDDGKTWQWLDSGNWNALSLPWVAGPHGQIGKLGILPSRQTAGARRSR